MEYQDPLHPATRKTLSNGIHRVLAQSYFFYFFMFLAGVFLDLIFHIRIFKSPSGASFGLALLVLASILIIWAQTTSRNLEKGNITKETFCRGPYCYTRSPTHLGLFLLIVGFGILTNAFFVILFTVVSFIITRFIFIRKEEEALAEKYGAPYLEYKKKVKI
jgi:protein-S-isoprenylcysteine O-methyltransferase Ste14